MSECHWLPPAPQQFGETLNSVKKEADPIRSLAVLRQISQFKLDFLQCGQVNQLLHKALQKTGYTVSGFTSLKFAFLSSSTTDHLLAGLNIAALRRGVLLEIYRGDYNQYRQEILDDQSQLYRFKPDVVLLAMDAAELDLNEERLESTVQSWVTFWSRLQAAGATVIHQNIVVPPIRILGEADALTSSTPQALYSRLNQRTGEEASKQKVVWLNLDDAASRLGKNRWCDWPLWHHAKQAISPEFAPLYGDWIARLLAAIRGLSKKCLVLDLDNTLWGGVIGDDGLDNLELGQGTGLGEAFQAFQSYVKKLHERGVLLAVCSKNEPANARLPFERHPEMRLHVEDFASFVANWNEKATNLRTVAEQLNIGLDSLVFFDDNPAERAWIRQVLPDVAVPEVPEDPAWFITCLSDAGYFESLRLTQDDLQRNNQYAENRLRNEAQNTATDMASFLASLQMEMKVSAFDDVGRSRIAQLINKSNQFNLTTRRYTETQVEQSQHEAGVLTFQIRLKDAFGDNGMISVLILKPIIENGQKGFLIDTWLMSCRVLGRQVEQEVLNVIAAEARKSNATFLRGEYIPTPKNGLVVEHYQRLGFSKTESPSPDSPAGATYWHLPLGSYRPVQTAIRTTINERNDHVSNNA